MFKRALIVLVVVFSLTTLSEGKQMKVRVLIPTKTEFSELLPLDMDIVYIKQGEFVDIFVNETEHQVLRKQGFELKVLIPDLGKYYAEIMDGRTDFGPYYTYAEMQEELDSLHAAFPEIVGQKIDIGTSWEGRTIWAVKVSDNLFQDENEGGVLYTGVTHAREPIGCTICLELIRYLAEQYQAGNSEVVYVVDSAQLWFIPVVNPDGYVYNETGSGWWRKNCRKDSLGELVGVDLNRNFPYEWGYDHRGSSPNPGSETYRGPSLASEPETQAIIGFCEEHNFATAVDYHSYGNVLLTPWCYDTFYTPDSADYREMGDSMSLVNGYPHGTGWEVMYFANGVSKDWEYGKLHIFDFTVEVGERFWQPDTAIIREQFEENLYLNLYLARRAIFLGVQSHKPSKSKWSFEIYPNPFRNLLYLKYQVNKGSDFVNLKVYDVSGRLVKIIVAGKRRMPGIWSARWDGQDEMNRSIPAGVYFCRLEIGELNETKKVILLR